MVSCILLLRIDNLIDDAAQDGGMLKRYRKIVTIATALANLSMASERAHTLLAMREARASVIGPGWSLIIGFRVSGQAFCDECRRPHSGAIRGYT